MSAELYPDWDVSTPNVVEFPRPTEVEDRPRPNVSGDLPTVLQAAPMFRRAVIGYDRFQVDTYVQWAEDEIVTAEREREHLLARHLATQTALEEARRLLSHSSSGGEFLRLSDRIGLMLAAAADQAESIRAEAESMRAEAAADRSAACAQAERTMADAEIEAERVVAEAGFLADQMAARARRTVAAAERTAEAARAQAVARLEQVRVVEQRAADDAERIRHEAGEHALAARLQAKGEVLEILTTGREERRRADATATAIRQRLDQEAFLRRGVLLSEIAELEHRRAVLRAEVQRLAGAVAGPTGRRRALHLRRIAERLRWRHRFLRTP